MNKIINQILWGKDAKLSGFIALTVIMMIALGCTCGNLDKFKDDAKDNKSSTTDNKSTTSDNKSSKDDSSKNTSSKDSPFPSADDATPKKADKSDEGQKKSSDKDMPSDSETESLVKDLIQQFRNGVENEDFTDMREASSTAFKKTYTTNQIKTSFDVFIKNKERVGTILEGVDELTPEYTVTPSISVKNGYKVLTANGDFATSPVTTFNTSYVLEKGSWKMLTIEIKIRPN
jgi:hypothetical protein